jgi:flagellar biosynthesis/type III secretory pathway M-ring protein FliF/YscJ
LTTSTLVGFQEDIEQFISQVETSLKGKTFVTLSTIISNDNVQWSVKFKLDFVESKSTSKQKPS